MIKIKIEFLSSLRIKHATVAAALMVIGSYCAFGDNSQYILTPKPSLSPRINGAKVVGVRPGHKFLFKIPATGKRPLKYSARRLPLGLTLNSKTGIISGAVDRAGKYKTLITVRNSFGYNRRVLTIKVGSEICLTPPMGWNSWYCDSELVSEDAIRRTAKAMVEKGLVDHGWTYVNIDDCWQGERGGKYNAIQPNERFKNMKGMCDYLHSLGLKAGIYSTPWQGTYAGFIGSSAPNEQGDYSKFYLPVEKRLQKHQFFGRYPGSIRKGLNKTGHWFLDRDALQWAAWGFDYIKVDWNPNDVPTTKRIAEALAKCGRDIVLSLSNAAPFGNTQGLSKYANCWRTTGDIQDKWGSISGIGFNQEKWQKFMRQGHWNDPDMLQVGNIGIPNRKNSSFRPSRLSPDEQFTQISLWCLLSAPLLLSCDISSMDDFTLSLLTNDEVLEINQDPAAHPAKRVYHDNTTEIWSKPLGDGSIAVGLFNKSAQNREIELKWEYLGIHGKYKVRDLWRQTAKGSFTESFKARVKPHGVFLLKLKAIKKTY